MNSFNFRTKFEVWKINWNMSQSQMCQVQILWRLWTLELKLKKWVNPQKDVLLFKTLKWEKHWMTHYKESMHRVQQKRALLQSLKKKFYRISIESRLKRKKRESLQNLQRSWTNKNFDHNQKLQNLDKNKSLLARWLKQRRTLSDEILPLKTQNFNIEAPVLKQVLENINTQ